MRCPFCEHPDDKVIDSRPTDEGRSIRRRRKCLRCGKRFTTFEHVESHPKLVVIKRDNSRAPYDRLRIQSGIEKACYKRPVTPEQVSQVVDEVEEELFRRFEKEVSSLDIGQIIAEKLRRLDHVAYVRFASVYKQFRDLDDLLEEVKEVLDNDQRRIPGQQSLFP
ncbi:MAG: transcriptional repressor NrdR [Phycisphaeraceae bacterium]|nr:transcriptional repressor NrdR [Phycisphaeraceae bacterium]